MRREGEGGGGWLARAGERELPSRFRKRLPVSDIKLRPGRNLCSRARRDVASCIVSLNNADEIAYPALRAVRQIETSNSRNLYHPAPRHPFSPMRASGCRAISSRCMRRAALRIIVSKNINPPGILGLHSLTETPRSARETHPEIQKRRRIIMHPRRFSLTPPEEPQNPCEGQ